MILMLDSDIGLYMHIFFQTCDADLDSDHWDDNDSLPDGYRMIVSVASGCSMILMLDNVDIACGI
jgi:hypothetical protein